MPRFVELSRMLVNVDEIQVIFPGMVKPQKGESFGCTVYFKDKPEPYAFYGNDAKKLLELVKGG